MMKYVIVDIEKRMEFEKNYQMSFGYGALKDFIFDSFSDAVEIYSKLHDSLVPSDADNLVIERHTAGSVDMVYDSYMYKNSI